MKADELELRIQSLVDGALRPGERARAVLQLEDCALTRALYDELMITKSWLIPQNELPHCLDEDGQFYWSQIAAGILNIEEGGSAALNSRKRSFWAVRLVPILGIIILLIMPLAHLLDSARDKAVVASEVASSIVVADLAPVFPLPGLAVASEVSTVSYYANAGDVTVIWVKDGGLGYLP